jgi:hypothetical protein
MIASHKCPFNPGPGSVLHPRPARHRRMGEVTATDTRLDRTVAIKVSRRISPTTLR